ncbi:Autophagy-related protein 9 [Caenorhabditis elegans]|uniref:Autophagy-related protein 9 n=1 Tax=Caenorhabditis elegans TaxID=6239 RepID=Q9TXN6_CAEEL|nr:Autophagy-related protein 9 [Caenorhabditis elegans]CCD74231.2 Autophagy-related protein 9 [Caenorhabditis elegans]|eukprot:NP_503178.2 Autophagy-related protein 9 [Caenorhabditis elegans]
MFNSQSKRAYQQIDDDFDDEVLRNSTCTSRFMQGWGSSTRSLLFGGASNDEQRNLIASSSSHHSYHDSPAEEPPETHYEQFTATHNHGPPTMASSSQLNSRRWDHVLNLDEFFTHIYEYHQNGGYLCIVLQKVFSLLQFIFVMSFTTFFTQCVNYQFLFANTNVTSHGTVNQGKRHFGDAVVDNCPAHISIWMIFAILAAIVYWITRVIKHAQYIMKMSEIQQFYAHELKIADDQLPNLTWHAIVKRICEAQKKLRLSIHQDNITSIYIYHRILRYKNYMTGMINKRILHPVFDVPFLGPIAYLPNNLKHEIERILFTSSTSAWTNGPNLREEYKHHEQLDMAAKKMKEDCKFYGFLSLVLMPLLLPFQIMESFFSLTELIKRRPDGLGMRRYSNFGRYLLRHFNELDHELSARLNRSHIYAAAYMDQFFSPVLEIAAKNITFIAAAVFGVLTILSAWDEDVLQVEHVITVLTICGIVVLVCRGMIPDENLVWQPEILMTHVTSELHYLPSTWKGKAHTTGVRHEFDQLFQMKWMFFVLELTSPIFTPFVLLFWLRPRCSQLANFFHDYTERVDGLGDVCSFAVMDVGKHGDPKWNHIKELKAIVEDQEDQQQAQSVVTSLNRARDGKTELSILHFKTTNPEWQPPKASEKFLRKFRNRLGQEASMLAPLTSMHLGQQMDRQQQQDQILPPRNILLESVHSIVPTTSGGISASQVAPGRHPLIGDGLHRIDGPVGNAFQGIQGAKLGSGGVLASLYQEQPRAAESLSNSLRASGVDIDGAGAEMRINALFLRGLHDESIIHSSSRNYGGTTSSFNMHPTAMQSVFAMPDGFGQPAPAVESSLIDIETPTYHRESVQRSAAEHKMEHETPEPLAELPDLPGPSSSEHQQRSRLVPNTQHRQINEEEEEEEEEDNTPPLSFSS